MAWLLSGLSYVTASSISSTASHPIKTRRYLPDNFVLPFGALRFVCGPKPLRCIARRLLVVAQARGAAILATAESGVPVFEYTPLQIKKAVSGNGRAYRRYRAVVDATVSPPSVLYWKDLTYLGWPLDPSILTLLRSGTAPTSTTIVTTGGRSS